LIKWIKALYFLFFTYYCRKMKKLTLIIIISFFVSTALHSEQRRDFSLGPYLSLKAGVNAGNTMDGRKNGIAFTGIPDFGAQMYYPLSVESDLGIFCDLGLSNYAYYIEGVNVGRDYTLTYRYLTLSPRFYFNVFTFGFAVGMPLAADFGEEIDTDILEVLAEIRLAAFIPLMSDESGSLNLNIEVGYMFTGFYSDFAKNDPLLQYIPEVPPQVPSSKYNPRAVSLSIGISYLMNFYANDE
jgi:hypothetical protein